MKIGIMGGTFDPIHVGHLILAEQAKEQYSLDAVYVMPNGNPKYKSDRKITSSEHRVEMVKCAIEDNPNLMLSTIEIERQGYTYTYETLEELKRLHPENEYYFIIGADSLFSFENWKNPHIIARLCTLLIANRNQSSHEELTGQIQHLQSLYDIKIYPLSCPSIDISSEKIRERRAQGSSIRYYVTDKVYDYINTHALY